MPVFRPAPPAKVVVGTGQDGCRSSRKGDLVKLLWHDGVGMSLYLKRLEAGKFIWPVSQDGTAVAISAAQLGYLLEGIDWRNPRWTQRPKSAG
jgi:transposase